MRCGECDHGFEGTSEPNYCPECGEDWREKNLDDVDWPVTVTAGPRIDLHDLMKWETGIDSSEKLWSFSDDIEILIELEVNRDGSIEEVSTR